MDNKNRLRVGSLWDNKEMYDEIEEREREINMSSIDNKIKRKEKKRNKHTK